MPAAPDIEDLVHGDGAAEQDRAELVTVDPFGDGGTGVAGQVGDGLFVGSQDMGDGSVSGHG